MPPFRFDPEAVRRLLEQYRQNAGERAPYAAAPNAAEVAMLSAARTNIPRPNA